MGSVEIVARVLNVYFLVSLLFFRTTLGVNEKDKEECMEPLIGLATCLPYVGGTANSPTPDCCNGLKQVLNTNKKCLCVVIKDRNDPDLGLTINLTLALGLPTACHTSADISKCPALLHLAPNSPDAKVFSQYGHTSNVTASGPNASANATSTRGLGRSTPPESNGSGTLKMTLEIIVYGILCIFTSNLLT